jgi:CheY-like chemotaxis protein
MGIIFIVDDDAEIRTMLGLVLRLGGYESTSACNGQEALDRLKDGLHPTLILLDLMMPVMSGWDFLTALQREDAWKNIPVLALTGYSSMIGQHPIPGTIGVVTKPLDVPKFFEIVARYR